MSRQKRFCYGYYSGHHHHFQLSYKLEKFPWLMFWSSLFFAEIHHLWQSQKCKCSFHSNKWVGRVFEIGYWSVQIRENLLPDDHLLQASVSIMIKKRFYLDKEIYRSNRLLLAFSRLTLIHCNVITSFRILKIQTNKKQPVNFNALKIPKKSQFFLHFQLWAPVLKI